MAEPHDQEPPHPKSNAVGNCNAATAAAVTSGWATPPCGACKFLRRKCVSRCVFAPYFGSDQGTARFAAVHKVFGASNVSKLLVRIPASRRHEAVSTVSYEAQARLSDPVCGCVSTILALQHQVASLQAELSMVQTQLLNSRMAMANQQQQNQFLLQHQQQRHHLMMQQPQQPQPQPAYSNNPSASTQLTCGFTAISFDLTVQPLSSDQPLPHPPLQPQTPDDDEDESRSKSEAGTVVLT